MYVVGLEVGLRLVIISCYGLDFVYKPTFTLTKTSHLLQHWCCRFDVAASHFKSESEISGASYEINIIQEKFKIILPEQRSKRSKSIAENESVPKITHI